MKNSTLTFIILIVLKFATISYAQTENKDVSITASGSGKTLEDAKQAALRSATEQAFGAFISTKTEMFNDQVVADQMASVSSGNIKSYEVLNESQLPDGSWGVTLKTIVSVDKLTSFVEAKGIAIEIKGGMFALNIKQQMLNEQGEVEAVAEMVGLLHELLQTSYDFVIKSGNPKNLNNDNNLWEIPISVDAIANKNMDFVTNYFIKTIQSLSLSKKDVETYKSLGKKVYPISINHKEATYTYYLRNPYTMKAIYSLFGFWNFYTRLYTINVELNGRVNNATQESSEALKALYGGNLNSNKNNIKGTDEIIDRDGHVVKLISNVTYGEFGNIEERPLNPYQLNIVFPQLGQTTARYQWKDNRTLAEIENMNGYKINPLGVVSPFKHGGYVVFEDNGHGFVLSIFDLGKNERTFKDSYSFDDSNRMCEELYLNGYNDWKLPNVSQLYKICDKFKFTGIGILSRLEVGINFPCFFWTTDKKSHYSYKNELIGESIIAVGFNSNGRESDYFYSDKRYSTSSEKNYVRAIREF
jgi:hypothetical protein